VALVFGMKRALHASGLCLLLAVLAGCGPAPVSSPPPGGSTPPAGTNSVTPEPPKTVTPTNPPAAPSATTNEVAIIKTVAGELVVEFWPDVAPATVANFKKLANQGFYNGTAFHRIIRDFMIQGGDPLSKDDNPRVGTGGPGYTIKDEFSSRPHVRGVLSMANTGQPNSSGCQFFICLAPVPFLDGKYTAFGKVIKGDDVLGRLGDTPVGPGNGNERSKPTVRAGVESVRIVPADSIK
jgi:peptidyl-prolyl cis-trans isomerase B (cyclophilin B)